MSQWVHLISSLFKTWEMNTEDEVNSVRLDPVDLSAILEHTLSVMSRSYIKLDSQWPASRRPLRRRFTGDCTVHFYSRQEVLNKDGGAIENLQGSGELRDSPHQPSTRIRRDDNIIENPIILEAHQDIFNQINSLVPLLWALQLGNQGLGSY